MKRFIILLPLLTWFVWLGWILYGQQRIAPYFADVDGMTWEINQTKRIAHLQRTSTSSPEEINFILTINDMNNDLIYTTELAIDYDLNNGGFVKAMQVDEDPEWEIVFATNNRILTQNFYVDVSMGMVETKSLETVPTHVKQIIKQYFTYYIPNVFGIALGAIFTIVFYNIYLLIFLVKHIVRVIRKKK